MLVDSHCHIDLIDSDYLSTQQILDSAAEFGVTHMLNVAINLNQFRECLAVAEANPHVFASVGVHPNEPEEVRVTCEQLVELANHPKIIAIGETGLDYFRTEGGLDWQQTRLREHIWAARRVNKPLIIHMRDAAVDTLAILKEEKASEPGAVMHCFTEDWTVAKQALDLSFYISLSGIVTFKSAESLREVARNVPADRLLIETDSPYLAPVPFRGKTNQPAYVKHVAEFVAQERGVSFEQLCQQTSENFARLFNLTLAA